MSCNKGTNQFIRLKWKENKKKQKLAKTYQLPFRINISLMVNVSTLQNNARHGSMLNKVYFKIFKCLFFVGILHFSCFSLTSQENLALEGCHPVRSSECLVILIVMLLSGQLTFLRFFLCLLLLYNDWQVSIFT